MLLSQILKSDNNRLIKEIIEEQIKNPWGKCWIKMVNEILQKYGLSEQMVRDCTKEKLSKMLKQKILEYLQTKLDDEALNKTKSRFCTSFKKKKYISLKYNDCITMIRVKLNMIYVKCNYKGNFTNNLACPLCKSEEDTTEHLFTCREIKKITETGPSIEEVKEDNNNEEICRFINTAMGIREGCLPQLFKNMI